MFRASLEGGAFVGLAVLVLASVFTLASMLKIWRFAFQTRPGEAAEEPGPASGALPLIAMLVLILALGFGAGPVQDYASAAASELLDASAYNHAVLGADGRPALQGLP